MEKYYLAAAIVIVLVVFVLALITRRLNTNGQRKKNTTCWENFNFDLQVIEIDWKKAEKIVDGIERNCADGITRDAKEKLAKINVENLKKKIKEIGEQLPSKDSLKQDQILKAMVKIEAEINYTKAVLRDIRALPELIVKAKEDTFSYLKKIEINLSGLEKWANDFKGVPARFKKELKQKKNQFLTTQSRIMTYTDLNEWYDCRRELIGLNNEIAKLIEQSNDLNFKRERSIEILKKESDRISYWVLRAGKYKELSEIKVLLDEAENSLDKVFLLLGEEEIDYDSISTEWNIVFSWLSNADKNNEKARLMFEEYDLWNS